MDILKNSFSSQLAMLNTRIVFLAVSLLGVTALTFAQTPAKPAKPAPQASAPKPMPAKAAAATTAKPAPASTVKPAPAKAAAATTAKPVAPATPAVPAGTRPQTEQELIAVLKKADAPLKDKVDVCRLAQRKGTSVSVAPLAALLADEKLSHFARYALESLPYSTVDAAFRAALVTLKGKQLEGVIASVAVRRDANAIDALIGLLKNEDPAIAQAAARAVGSIGTAAAARALEDAWSSAVPGNRQAIAEGSLRCAEALFVAKQRDPALAIYSRLCASEVPHQVRTAAIRGVILASIDPAVSLQSVLLRANDLGTVSSALRAGMDLPPNWALTEALTQAALQTSGDRKILILHAVGKNGDPDGLPALLDAVKSPDKNVQLAAVHAMAELGTEAAVPVLVNLLGDPVLGPSAKDSLAALQGKEADAAVLKLFKSVDKAQRRLGMELVARRQMKAQLPDLLKAVGDADPEIRQVAVKQIGELGGAPQLPTLLDLFGSASAVDLPTAEQALSELVTKVAASDAAAAVCARLGKAQPAQKAALVRVLGVIGGPRALEGIRSVRGRKADR